VIRTVGHWIVVATLCGIGAAGAQERPLRDSGPLRFGDDPTTTTTSGSGSTTTTRLAIADPSGFGLYGLRVAERSDEPCHVIALFEHLRNEGDDQTAVWSDCGPDGPTARSNAAAGFGDHDGRDPRAFVTGIEACVNNDKVKGVRLSGQKITPTGVMRDVRPAPPSVLRVAGPLPRAHTPDETEPTYSVFWRSNCNDDDWRPGANCGPGMAASALILHHRTATTQIGFRQVDAPRSQVSGLQLECRTVLRTGLTSVPR
jgi:hypothetical protein